MRLSSSLALPVAVTSIGVFALVAWFVWMDATAYHPNQGEALFLDRLSGLSGAKGTNCGSMPSTAPEAVLGCVQRATKRKTPFWFVEEFQGIDDFDANGTARDPQGRIWHLSYAEFASGPRPTKPPVLAAERCKNPILVTAPRVHFSCSGL